MRNLAYTVEPRLVSDNRTRLAHAVARCGACGHEGALKLAPEQHNPEAVGKKFRQLGWELKPFDRASVTCPGCIARRKALRAGERPEKPSADKPRESNVVALTIKPGGVPPQVTLSVEQKKRVRDFLGGTFDEAAGHYLEGYSDQKVGNELDLPFAAVREIRETAFGPLRSVPELAPLKAEAMALDERAAANLREAGAIKEATADLRRRIVDTARSLGVQV